MAERSLTQARQALESFMKLPGARLRPWSIRLTTCRPDPGTWPRRTFSAAEQNLRSSLDYAGRLVQAKDLQEATQIQSEFVRAQAEAMQTQMQEFGSAMQSAMGRGTDQAGAGADQATSGTTRVRGGKS